MEFWNFSSVVSAGHRHQDTATSSDKCDKNKSNRTGRGLNMPHSLKPLAACASQNYTKISGNWHCVYSTSPVHSWIWLTTGNRSSVSLCTPWKGTGYVQISELPDDEDEVCWPVCWDSLLLMITIDDYWRMCRGLHGPCNPDMAGRWGSRQESKLCLVLRVSPSVPACDNIWKCQILTRTDVQKFNMYYLDRELQKYAKVFMTCLHVV